MILNYLFLKIINKGFIVADLLLEFDELGNIKDNYKIKGSVKDGRINLFKIYNLNKIDFIFEFEDKNLKFNNAKLLLNNKNLKIPELIVSKKDNDYLISGKLNNQNIKLNKDEVKNFIGNKILDLDIQEIAFSSQNDFRLTINKKLKIKNININSNIELNNLKLKNDLKLKEFFQKSKKRFHLKIKIKS